MGYRAVRGEVWRVHHGAQVWVALPAAAPPSLLPTRTDCLHVTVQVMGRVSQLPGLKVAGPLVASLCRPLAC